MKNKCGIFFRELSDKAAFLVGTPTAFILSFISVIIWAAMGPFFNFSTTWQLIINTGTTIVTFWLVFLIQSSQNKDTKAIHLKLDQLMNDISEVDEKKLTKVEEDPEEMQKLMY